MNLAVTNVLQGRAQADAAVLPFPAARESQMREKLLAARDTAIVLGLQVLFRAMLLFRQWFS